MKYDFYQLDGFSIFDFVNSYCVEYDNLYHDIIPETEELIDNGIEAWRENPVLSKMFKERICDIPFSDREMSAYALTCELFQRKANEMK